VAPPRSRPGGRPSVADPSGTEGLRPPCPGRLDRLAGALPRGRCPELASLRASAERDEPDGIGRFGVGFAAGLAVTDEPAVLSTPGGVRFSAHPGRRAAEPPGAVLTELRPWRGTTSRWAGCRPGLSAPRQDQIRYRDCTHRRTFLRSCSTGSGRPPRWPTCWPTWTAPGSCWSPRATAPAGCGGRCSGPRVPRGRGARRALVAATGASRCRSRGCSPLAVSDLVDLPSPLRWSPGGAAGFRARPALVGAARRGPGGGPAGPGTADRRGPGGRAAHRRRNTGGRCRAAGCAGVAQRRRRRGEHRTGEPVDGGPGLGQTGAGVDGGTVSGGRGRDEGHPGRGGGGPPGQHAARRTTGERWRGPGRDVGDRDRHDRVRRSARLGGARRTFSAPGSQEVRRRTEERMPGRAGSGRRRVERFTRRRPGGSPAGRGAPPT
jgi:hypothetical protein